MSPIISIFLVLTLVSSLSAAAFVSSNVSLVFAKKHSGSSNGGGSSSSDNSGGETGSGSSSSSGGTNGGSSSENNGGQATTGGSANSNGGGGSGSSNTATSSPSTSTTQRTCPDDLILNSDDKCVPKSQSATPVQREKTGNTTTTTQMKTANTGGNAGTTTTTSTTPSSAPMQTTNNGGNTGTGCKGLSQFDPTTGTCVAGNPSTTQMQTSNTGGNAGTTTTATTQTETTKTQTGGNAGTKCTGLSQFDPTTGTCVAGNPSTTTQTLTGTGGAEPVSTPKSFTLPSAPAILGNCPSGTTKSGVLCVSGADSCRASGGTVTGTECVYNTPPPPTTTPSTCGPGLHYDQRSGKCLDKNNLITTLDCTGETHANPVINKCEPDSQLLPLGLGCSVGFHLDDVLDPTGHTCFPDTSPSTDSISQQGNCQPGDHMIHGDRNNCVSAAFPYDDGTCPPGRAHLGNEQYYCSIPPVLPGSTTGVGGGFIKMIPTCPGGASPDANGKCPTPTTQTGNTGGSTGTATSTSGTTSPMTTMNTGGGTTATGAGTTTTSKPTSSSGGGTAGTTTTTSSGAGGTTSTPGNNPVRMVVDSPASADGTCPGDSEHVSGPTPSGDCITHILSPDGMCPSGTTAVPNTPVGCVSDHVFTPSTSTGTTTNTGGNTSTPMTTSMKTGSGTTPTSTGTAAATGGANGTGTSTSTTTSTTTTKIINNNNVIKGGRPASASSVGATQAPTTPSVTYVNIPDKITIRYPSTWTKTEFADNPSIPVIFNAPINDSTAAATKTTLMVNINQLTPSSATPNSYTQQQINALTNSSVIKYTITDTNAKVLTPPAGIAAYREISYNGIKNSTVNNIPTQIPLKGTAIFFVNGNTGYSLLYLAKQTEYDQNLPTVQQMINTFQINATNGGVGSVGSTNVGGGNNR